MKNENNNNKENNKDIILYTAKDIKNIFHCSINTAYAFFHTDGFPSIKINGSYYIPKYEFEKWLQKNIGRNIIVK